MNNSLFQVVGIELAMSTINISHIDQHCNLLLEKKIIHSSPMLPGLVSIKLCEYIQSVDDINGEVKSVGICLQGKLGEGNRSIKECKYLPGWNDVPLVDWLELRLGLKVILAHSSEYMHFIGNKNKNIFNQSDKFLSYASFSVGRLALETFLRCNEPF